MSLIVWILSLILAAPSPHGTSARELPKALRQAKVALLAQKSAHRLYLFNEGQLAKTYVIGLSQRPVGRKEREGDNRTPEGQYIVIQKAVGPFPGEYGAYLGTRWLRINYPNDEDARLGLRKGIIGEAQYTGIVGANQAGREPPKDTPLGGGIGIHGWNGPWPGPDQQNVTWGCLSLQKNDLEDLYDRVPVGTPILIVP
jgi:murein L,D-transpeptidase YafK